MRSKREARPPLSALSGGEGVFCTKRNLSPSEPRSRPVKSRLLRKSILQPESGAILRPSPVGRLRCTNGRSVQETRFERDGFESGDTGKPSFGEQKESRRSRMRNWSCIRASAGNAGKALKSRRNPSVADAAGASILAWNAIPREQTSPLIRLSNAWPPGRFLNASRLRRLYNTPRGARAQRTQFV